MFSQRELLVRSFVGHCQISMIRLAGASKHKRQRYHAVAHPGDVYLGATRVLKLLVGDEAAKTYDDLALMTSCVHDIIQEAEVVMGPRGFNIRQRKRGQNEETTANWGEIQLNELQHVYGPASISNDEIAVVKTGTQWTIPAWDPKFMTMVQPGLWKGLASGNWHPVPVAVAMGDLLPCGHHPETFLGSSDPLFVEEQLGMDDMLFAAAKQSDIPPERAATALDVMRAWDAGQVNFALGREKAFDYETSLLLPPQRDALRSRINKFQESAARARWKADGRLGLNFFQYASAMGFQSVPIG